MQKVKRRRVFSGVSLEYFAPAVLYLRQKGGLYVRDRCAVCFDGGGALPDELLSCLPEERLLQLGQLHPRYARQSALAEALLRMLLAEETGRSPRSFEILRERGEKPRCPGFEFSLSHTDGAAAAMVSENAVGVDIEKIRTPRLRVAGRFFPPDELEYMRERPAPRFWKLWTRREAVFKQGGSGKILNSCQINGYALSVCGSICEPELLSLDELALRLRSL